MHYVKGNTSRFGSAIQLLPSKIRDYFKLSFIIVVVVFISIFDFFSLFYSEITLCNLYYFCFSNNVFLIIVEFFLLEIKFTYFYLLTYLAPEIMENINLPLGQPKICGNL